MEYWPEGGWIPEGALRTDPWGEPYLLKPLLGGVRLTVKDPGKAINPEDLTEEEIGALKETARSRLTEPQKKAVERFVDRLGDDDLETRELARRELRIWGGAIQDALAQRLKMTKDRLIRERLEIILQPLLDHIPAWHEELGELERRIYAWSTMEANARPSFDRYAVRTLQLLVAAQKRFQSEDPDTNGVNDYWVGDVAGLFALAGSERRPIRLIARRLAAADSHPRKDLKGDVKYAIVPLPEERGPLGGYYFRAIGAIPEATEESNLRNRQRFAFSATPAEYGVSGRFVLIVNQEGLTYYQDTQGREILRWPTLRELKSRWRRLP